MTTPKPSAMIEVGRDNLREDVQLYVRISGKTSHADDCAFGEPDPTMALGIAACDCDHPFRVARAFARHRLSEARASAPVEGLAAEHAAAEWLEELEDEVEQAISDSFDEDWVARDAARHVIGLLEQRGILTALTAHSAETAVAEAIERCAKVAEQRGEQFVEPTQSDYDRRDGCYFAATAIREGAGG